MSCLDKLKKSLDERNVEIPQWKMKQWADVLDRMKAESLTRADFSAKVEEFLQKSEQDYAKQQAADAISLAHANAARDLVMGPDNKMGGTLLENLRAFFGAGGIKPGFASRISAKTYTQSIEGRIRQLWNPLIEPYKDLLGSKAIDPEIIREVYAMENGTEVGKTGSPEAVKIAEAMRAVSNLRVQEVKARDPYFDSLKNYLMKQVWDRDAVSQVPEQEFVKRMLGRPGDLHRAIADPADLAQTFGSIYRRIRDGIYGSPVDDQTQGGFLDYSKGTRDLMKTTARQRVITFDNPEDFIKTMQEFNPKGVAGTMENTIRSSARTIAQLDLFGPQSEKLKDYLIDQALKSDRDPKEVEQLRNNRGRIEADYRQATGQAQTPARFDPTTPISNLAKKGALDLMQWTGAARLGMSGLHTFPDIVKGAMEMRGLDGQNLFGSAAELMGSFARAMVDKESRRAFMQEVGLGANIARTDIFDRYGANTGQSGVLGRLANMTPILSGLSSVVESLKTAAGGGIARRLSAMAGQSLEKLEPQAQRWMGNYGIEAPEWEFYRKAAQPSVAGTESWMTKIPDSINQATALRAPDSAVVDYMRAKEMTEPRGGYTAGQIDVARNKLAYQIGAAINDAANYGSAHPGDRQMANMFLGKSVNDPGGLALRLFWQFKQSLQTTADSYRRAYYAGTAPRAGFYGVAQAAVITTFLTVVADEARRAAMGESPSVPSDPKYVAAMIARGGAGGFLGESIADTMLNSKDISHAVKGGLESVVGPVASNVYEGAAALGHGIGQQKWGPESAWLYGQVPGQNLPFIQGAMKYYFLNGLREFLGPGFIGNLLRNQQGPNGARPDYFMMNPAESRR
jgi:hypothetical protein